MISIIKWHSVEKEGIPKLEYPAHKMYLISITRTGGDNPEDMTDDPLYVETAIFDSSQNIWHLHNGECINALLGCRQRPPRYTDIVDYWAEMPDTPDDTDPDDYEKFKELLKHTQIVTTTPDHGKWEYKEEWGRLVTNTCSICGQTLTTRTREKMKFCPNCGAKMDLE